MGNYSQGKMAEAIFRFYPWRQQVINKVHVEYEMRQFILFCL